MQLQRAVARSRVRIGRYAILGRMGQGGMGTVYRALDEPLEREVALETLSAEGRPDADGRNYLQKARAEPPSCPGLSRGTAAHYMGLALEKLGCRLQAADAYRVAAAAKDATLIDNDGPAVASIAARRATP